MPSTAASGSCCARRPRMTDLTRRRTPSVVCAVQQISMWRSWEIISGSTSWPGVGRQWGGVKAGRGRVVARSGPGGALGAGVQGSLAARQPGLTMLLVPTRCETPEALLLSSSACQPTLAAQLGLTLRPWGGELPPGSGLPPPP
jgi:hypothetical protein